MVWSAGLGFSWLCPLALDHSLSFPICEALLGPEASTGRISIPPLKAGHELGKVLVSDFSPGTLALCSCRTSLYHPEGMDCEHTHSHTSFPRPDLHRCTKCVWCMLSK